MELSELIFKSNTTDLERVSKVIGDLVTDISKLDKASRDAAQTEAILARAAKDNAKANLENAKAQDVRLKTTITADKADKANEKSTLAKTKALESHTKASKENASILQRQTDIYDFLAQGFSKGQASILASAKATGQYSKELEQVLELQKQFTSDPFDRSDTGLKRLQRTIKEVTDAQNYFNDGHNLTSKQARELSNDLDRLNAGMKQQGKSYQEIVRAQSVYKQQFLEEAKAVNQANSALAVVEKQRKEVVTATNYVTQADQRMAAALNTSNAALDKAGTDSLVRYETALRKSGVSQDVATDKLAKYKVQLAQVQEQEMKRREQHLTRAISPQLMDIGVSLYSGQNPMTVLIQQSGQLVDLFQLSGVEASKLGEAMRKSFYSMVPAIATVTKGLTNLFFGLFYDAGKGITNFISNITGMNKVLQHTDDILYLIGGRATWFSKILATLGTIASVTFGTGVLAIVAGLAALAVGLKQVITENNDLAKAFALSGASIGLSHTQMIGYVKTLADSGATTGQATEALLAMAKAGNFTSSEILLVSDAAIQMQKGFGIAIEDTVKQFAKLKEKPVEALLEIAKSSGMVGPEVIKMVQELERAGKSTEAASVAMKAYANVTKQQVAQMKENYNGFALFMIDLGQKIKQFFSDTFKTLFLATDPNQHLQDQLVKLRERIKEVSGNLQSLGSFGDPKLLNQLKEQERMLISQIGANVRIRGEEERRKYLNAENAKYESAIAGLRGNALDAIEKETRKTQTLAEFRKSFINDKLKEAAKEKSVDIEKLKLNTDLMNILQQQADIEYKKTQKSGSKSENYYATLMREATNNTIAANTATQELTKSEQKLLEVKADPRFAKLTTTQQADVVAKYEAAIAAERQTAMTEKLAEAEEHRLKLLGKSEGIGKQYYADMQKLEEFAKVAGWSREEIEELTRAVFKSTPAWKAYEKALEDVNTASRKFQEDSLASQASVLQENRSLDHRLSLLGKTTEEQKALVIEYNRANKLREVDVKLAKQLREIEEKIAKAKKDGLKEGDYQSLINAELQARKDAAEEQKAINREVAVQYREDFQREFIDPIRKGLTDSIVTALFEGSKAGSKKAREVFTNIMRQKVTMVVDVAVNAFINNLAGSAANSLFGGGGGRGGLSGLSNLWDMVSGGLNIAAVFGQKIAMQAGGWLANVGMETASQMVGQFGAGMMNTSSIGAFTSAFEAGGAQMAGAIAGSVLNGFAGYSISKLISGGYQVNKYVDKIAGVASAIPGIGPIAGVIGGGINRLFGRKLKESGIEGTFGGETGFEGRTYQFYKGGVFRSNKTKYGELDEETRSNFAKSFFDMKSGVAEMAKILGVGTESLEDFTYKFKVNLKGLSEEEATKAIQEQFKLMGEEMAKLVLSTDKYSLAEETRMDTLIRLSATLSTVNTIFENMGMTMYEMGLAGADAAYELTQLFGGLDQFKSSLSNYYEKFYSEEEQNRALEKQLNDALSKVNLQLPKIDTANAREQYKALVNAQDLSTESGRQAWSVLIKLSDAFDQLRTSAESVSTQKIEKLKEGIDSLVSKVSSAFEGMRKSSELLDKINTAITGVPTDNRGRELEILAKINTVDYPRQISLAEELTDLIIKRNSLEQQNAEKILSFGKSLRSYVDSLKLGNLSPLTTGERLTEASKQFSETLRKAQAGDETARGELTGKSNAYLEIARTYFASGSEYTKIFNSVTASLDSLSISALTEAQQQLAVSNSTLAELQQVKSIVEKANEAATKDFEESSQQLKTQVSLLNRMTNGVFDVKGLLASMPADLADILAPMLSYNRTDELNSLIAMLRSTKATNVHSTTSEMLDYGISQGYTSDLVNKGISQLYSDDEIRRALVTAKLGDPGVTDAQWKLHAQTYFGVGDEQWARVNGSHANGLSYVPFNGYVAKLHEGERVLTRRENISYSNSENNSELLSEIRELKNEVSRLRAENRQDAAMVANATVAASDNSSNKIVVGLENASSRSTYVKKLEEKAILR